MKKGMVSSLKPVEAPWLMKSTALLKQDALLVTVASLECLESQKLSRIQRLSTLPLQKRWWTTKEAEVSDDRNNSGEC